MSDEETAVARSLGINEAVVVKLMACQEVNVFSHFLVSFSVTFLLGIAHVSCSVIIAQCNLDVRCILILEKLSEGFWNL